MNRLDVEDKAHFYYCALVALKFAAKYQVARSPTAHIIFLSRWLRRASDRRLFSRGVEPEIVWLRQTISAGGPFMNIEQLLLTVYKQAHALAK
ncbi:hypothetical protein [Pantoea piersonii]|uniref:hypothetical protein n=1 Tax=Pantoea piersonii TaxID=2364647 RepID=UPI0022F1D262|nr:hypothetical protein [Pantoea piersonii]WBV24100.1 hypothetical protein PG877_22375 [Pantoea piersonii]